MENKLTQFDDIFKKIYYKPSNPGSFGGRERLFNEAKKHNPAIKRSDVENWLKGQIVYTLHKQKRNIFKRNHVIAEFPFENLQADLVDYQLIASSNDGYKFILTVIDVFTKKAYAKPLKNKSKTSVTQAMKEILSDIKPVKIMTDKGKEFENSEFKQLMNKNNINHFFAKNKAIKCSIVERFNKTLKNRLQKYITLNGKNRWIDILPMVIDSYNNSFHRSIKTTPENAVVTDPSQIFKNLYGYISKREYLRHLLKPKHKIGDDVRIKYDKKTHDRGYYPNWTDQTYKIFKSISGKVKPYYRLEDSRGNISEKRYYPEEVQKVTVSSYRVEKVLKHRKRNGIKEVLVKWLNYPDSENSWIPENNLTGIDG